MGASTRRYTPYDYRAVCMTCGFLRMSSDIQWRGDVSICTYDMDERTRSELARASASMIPFKVRPVPRPRPQDNLYPNTLEADEGALLDFVATMVAARARYFDVTNGGAPLAGEGVAGLSRAAIYLYGVIAEDQRPERFISLATSLLGTCATYLMTRQQGFGLSASSTRANDAFYGGFLETGGSAWLAENAAASGLALLRAYSVTGTAAYLTGARAAASFLRNLQAIGSNGTNYTSSDAAGTSRLYTGGITKSVANVAGFYSDSLFYPSSLIALEFWDALLTVDGDQSVGSVATPTGFATAPAAMLSDAIDDLRAFWLTGTLDAYSNAVITGLSATTPREMFNAYPATKPNFPTVTGSGSWEYQDGAAATGTTITGSNFAQALGSLYAVDGATSQVTAVNDWLRLFESNATFETPDNASPATLASTSTGDYDPTQSLATLLLVRDSAGGYAATAKNASSLYDWGAFGLLAHLWGARKTASFKLSRLYPLGVVRRFDNGTPLDAVYDRITLRGRSGLSYQTAFTETVAGSARRVNDLVAAAQFGMSYREART